VTAEASELRSPRPSYARMDRPGGLSYTAEDGHWVDAGGATGRDVTGEQGDQAE